MTDHEPCIWHCSFRQRANIDNIVSSPLNTMAIAFITPTTTTIQPMITTHVITRSHHDHYTSKNIPHQSLQCQPQNLINTLVYPSIRLSNFSYAAGASSMLISFDTTKLGLARPEMIRSRSWRLYALTLHCPVPSERPCSQ